MNKLGTKLGAIAMSAVMALSFAPSAAITSLAASGDDLLDATFGVEPVYRLYNPNSGEHLFTTDVLERDSLVKENWDNEGAKWNAPSVSAEGIYRLYNPSTGEHLYTSDGLEIAHLVNDEKWEEDFGGYPAFYAADDDLDPDAITINRFFNPAGTGVSAHIFSADPAEIKALTDKGYEKENGFGGYPLDYEPEEPVEELTVSIDNPTPKVGDTLTAEVVDRNGKDVSDNVTFQWYADDVAIEGADEETLVVDDELLGAALKVVVTAENGNTFESVPTAEVYAYSFEIEEAKASKVNEITVTFANPVEAENVTFTVTKGNEAFPIEKVTADNWSLDEKEVTLKTSANMAKGTYTVTATDSVTKDTDSANFEVKKQEVDRIEIKNTQAYTNADADPEKAHLEAYAYYDVLDQYGESIRSSASIQWAGSCDITADKANGMLTLKKTGDGKKAWVYGEKIYITGVYTKTGKATSETLTVNTEQSLDTIDIKGFLKKGTSKIIEDLPEDFKTEAYYMLFNALDQNGCPLKADQIDREDVTFITDSPLVVKEVTFGEAGAADATDNKVFTVEGTEYNGVFVNPGINVAKGGEVNVTAIANKTGNKTDYNFWVGPDAVVESFDISSPSGVVADGDQSVAIPFEAKTPDGTVITNFKQLAKQEIFNTLSFTTSEGKLRLAEQNDRSAKLTWSDEDKYAATTAWGLSTSTDDIDRPVSLTAIVVGGQPDNEMISVQDKRRPNSIAEVKLDDVYVEGAELPISLGTFKFYDQYGKLIGTTWGADNGFFAEAKKTTVLKNTDFSGYTFGVRIEYAGTGKIDYTAGVGTTAPVAESKTGATADGKKVVIESGETAKYSTTTDIKSVATGEGFKFEIAKFKPVTGKAIGEPGDWDSVSPSKYKPITVVDITQVKNFTIGDLNTFYTGKLDITGDKIIAADEIDYLKDSEYTYYANADGEAGLFGLQNDTNYQQEIVVKGTYNTSTVTVPHNYYTVSTTKGSLVDGDGDTKDTFDTVGLIKYTDLYDKTTANGNAKLGQDEVVAEIIQLYGENENTTGYWILELGTDGKPTGDFVVDTKGTYKTPTAANAQIDANKANAKKVVQSDAANEVLAEYLITPETTTDTITGFISDNPAKTQGQVNKASEALTNAKNARSSAEYDRNLAQAALTAATTKAANAAAYKQQKTADQAATAQALDAADNAYDGSKSPVEGTAVTALAAAKNTATDAVAEEADKLWGKPYSVTVGGETVLGTLGTTTDDAVITAIVNATDDTVITANKKTAAANYLIAYKECELAKAAYNKAKADDDDAQAALAAATQAETDANKAKADAQTDYDIANAAWETKDAAVTAAQGDYDAAVRGYAASEATTAGSDFDLEVTAKKGLNDAGKTTIPAVYDTAKKDITYSDQAPYAADITGLKDSYIFNPIRTVIKGSSTIVGGFYDATQEKGKGDLKVVDQYGVTFAGNLEFTISNAVEDKDGYAENNFKVSDNGTNAPTIDGAEIGDTFDLVISVAGETLKKTTKVTVGADTWAAIENNDNLYTKTNGLKDVLEAQRKAGLQ